MPCTVWGENSLLKGAWQLSHPPWVRHVNAIWSCLWVPTPPTRAAYTCFGLGTKKKKEWLLVYTCASSRNPLGSCTNTLASYPSIGSRSGEDALALTSLLCDSALTSSENVETLSDVYEGSGWEHWSCVLCLHWRQISLQRTSVSGHLWETRYLFLFLLSIALARWGEMFDPSYLWSDKIESHCVV